MTTRASIIVAAFLSALSMSASAMVLTAPARVTKFDVYTDYGTGDVLFNVDVTVAGCDGFWLFANDGGFKAAYAALVMAKATGSSVVVYAYDAQLWPGSSAKYCKVRTLTSQ